MIIITPAPILSGCGKFFNLSDKKFANINDTNVAINTPRLIKNQVPLAIMRLEYVIMSSIPVAKKSIIPNPTNFIPR